MSTEAPLRAAARFLQRPVLPLLALAMLLAWAFAIRVDTHAVAHERFVNAPDRLYMGRVRTSIEVAQTLLNEGRWFMLRPSRMAAMTAAFQASGSTDPGPWATGDPAEPLVFVTDPKLGRWTEDAGFGLVLAGWWRLTGHRTLVVGRQVFLLLDLVALAALYVVARRLTGPWLGLLPVLLFADAAMFYEVQQQTLSNQVVVVYPLIAGLVILTAPPARRTFGARLRLGLWDLAYGAFCGFMQLWRSAMTPFGIALVAAAGVVRGWRRALALGVVYAVGFTAVWGSYTRYMRANSLPGRLLTHNIWFGLLEGLGEFDNPWGLAVDDAATIQQLRTRDPTLDTDDTAALEAASSRMFLSAVRAHPTHYVLILCQRLTKALSMKGNLDFPHLQGLVPRRPLGPAVLVCAAIGLWGAVRRRDRTRLGVTLLGAYFLAGPIAILTWNPAYYAAPLPVYALLAACGVADVRALGRRMGVVARGRRVVDAVSPAFERALAPLAGRAAWVVPLAFALGGGLVALGLAHTLARGVPLGAEAGYAAAATHQVSVLASLQAIPRALYLGPGSVLALHGLRAVGLNGLGAETVFACAAGLVLCGGTAALASRTGRWPAALVALGVLLLVPGGAQAGLAQPDALAAAALWIAATAAICRGDGRWAGFVGAAAAAVAATACHPVSAGFVLLPLCAAWWTDRGQAVRLAIVLGAAGLLGLWGLSRAQDPGIWHASRTTLGALALPRWGGPRFTWEALALPAGAGGAALLYLATATGGDAMGRRLALVALLVAGAYVGQTPVASRALLLAVGGAWLGTEWATRRRTVQAAALLASIVLVGQAGFWILGTPRPAPATELAALGRVRQELEAAPGPLFLEEYFALAPANRARPAWHGWTERRLTADMHLLPLDLIHGLETHRFGAVLFTGTHVTPVPPVRRALLTHYAPRQSVVIPTGPEPRLVTIFTPRQASTAG